MAIQIMDFWNKEHFLESKIRSLESEVRKSKSGFVRLFDSSGLWPITTLYPLDPGAI